MALPTLNDDLAVISKLDDLPNDVGGLTAAELKAKFDEAADTIKTYINNTLLPYLESVSGAGDIGITTVSGIQAATNVQQALAALEANIQGVSQGFVADNSINTAKLVDSAVTNAKLANNSVSAANIMSNAVTNEKMADSSVGTSELIASAVTTAKLANGSVSTIKLADGAVTAAKVAAGAITNSKLANSSVVADNIAANSVITSKILNSAITSAKIADGAVTDSKIADSAVTNVKIADGAVSGSKLATAYLPLTGGIVTGNTYFTKDTPRVELQNTNAGSAIQRRMQVVVNGSDVAGLYDKTNEKWIINSDSSQGVNVPHPLYAESPASDADSTQVATTEWVHDKLWDNTGLHEKYITRKIISGGDYGLDGLDLARGTYPSLNFKDGGYVISSFNGLYPKLTGQSQNITIKIHLADENENIYNYPAKMLVFFRQPTTYTITFAPDTGVTLCSLGNKRRMAGQYAFACLKYLGNDTWWLFGDLA